MDGKPREDYDPDRDSHTTIREEKTNGGLPNVQPQNIAVWQPSQVYFSDYYERRSDLDSFLIVSMAIGEDISHFDRDLSRM
ncbi:hypothetical protein F4818DRAFT_413592 [Hypoxylon cercidicola]|nr:hypothetical protein F4818DRAFT_413592 [Hypoxylon cercidicola]